MESPEQENREDDRVIVGKNILSKWTRIFLLVSFSISVFALASLSMYGAWVTTYMLNDMTRGVAALFVWIATFGVGTVAFWKIVEELAAEGVNIT